jgi:hypothetical protein
VPKDGKPGNMYKNLGKDDAEKAANLEKIKNLVGNWTLKRKKERTENVSKYQKNYLCTYLS